MRDAHRDHEGRDYKSNCPKHQTRLPVPRIKSTENYGALDQLNVRRDRVSKRFERFVGMNSVTVARLLPTSLTAWLFQDLRIEILVLRHDEIATESLAHRTTALGRNTPVELWIGQQPDPVFGHSIHVGGIAQKSGDAVIDHLVQASDTRGNHGDFTCHGFKRGETKTFLR